MYVCFMVLLYVHYRKQSLRLTHLLVPMMVLYIFGAMITHVRYTTSIPDMVRAGAEMLLEDPTNLLPFNVGELTNPPLSLMLVGNSIREGNLDFSWGYTYLTEMAVWIPRVILPDRPLPLPERYMSLFFLEEHLQGRGRGFFIPTEGYWAFGIPGVALQMFVYGAIISILYRFFRTNKDSDPVLLIYGVAIFSLVFTGVRTGLIGILKATLMTAFPFAVMLWISSRRQTVALSTSRQKDA